MSELLYYDRQILSGLSKVPVPTTPGGLIVTSNAQAIFTGRNAGDVVIAGTQYGNGKVIVTSHDCYLNWLNEDQPGVKKAFMTSLKKWFSNGDSEYLLDSEIGDLTDDFDDFASYKLLKWHQDVDLSQNAQSNLLNFIENGGGLFCGSTPWGYLQIYPHKTLKDMTMYNFLKDYFGIILTPNYLHFDQNEVDITMNQAKISNFDKAYEKVAANPGKMLKYSNTIQTGLDILNKEGILSEDKICHIKNCILDECKQKNINIQPSEKNPVSNANEMNALKLIGKCYQLLNDEIAPGIEKFPGKFTIEPELKQDIKFNFQTKFSERLSTGYYLPAGINLLINVDYISNDQTWSIMIGSHSDDLSNCNQIKRWPSVTICKELKSDNLVISSPFGGLIYVLSPEHGGQIKLTMNNLVDSPFIDLTQPETLNEWDARRKNSPGLWAELGGKHIIFTTPSKCIRHLSLHKCTEVLHFWDRVVETHHNLRSTNVNDFKRERVVNDIQPSCGYMHSGYPIVTHLDCCEPSNDECIFDVNKLMVKGNWGLFHELGHNMQRGEWTFEAATEVTVNLFSMHAFQVLIGKNVNQQKWLMDHYNDFDRYFAKQPTYQNWKSNFGMALVTFAILIKYFGWSSMYEFMKNYEKDIQTNKSLPRGDQDKIDQWVLRYSKIVAKNIKPHFLMFGLPVTNKYDLELKHLEPWCIESEKKAANFFSL